MTNDVKTLEEILYLTDERKNVVCLPYSSKNLKKMADDLGLKQSWFKKTHYLVPEDVYLDSIEDKCNKVSTTTLFRTIHNIM